MGYEVGEHLKEMVSYDSGRGWRKLARASRIETLARKKVVSNAAILICHALNRTRTFPLPPHTALVGENTMLVGDSGAFFKSIFAGKSQESSCVCQPDGIDYLRP